MKHKKLFITLIVFFSIFVFLGTFLMIWFWGDSYKDFDDFTQIAEIPGLDDGAVPQGLANYTGPVYDAEGLDTGATQDYMFISAYMKEGPSRIYVTGLTTGYVGYVTMKNTDETYYYGHCGGVATNGTRLWLASDGQVFVAERSSEEYNNIANEIIIRATQGMNNVKDEETGEPKNVIAFTASFNANCNASFVYYFDATGSNTDKLYVGEFYRPGDYETDERHHITTASGAEQKAFAYEYNVTTVESNEYGLSTISEEGVDPVPRINSIYSLPAQIQGFARIPDDTTTSTSAGKLVLSESWGLANSKIYYYDWSKLSASTNRKMYSTLTEKNFAYEGVYYPARGDQEPVQYTDSSLNVYFIDDSFLERTYSIPSMAEGMCVMRNRVYVLFESGSYKYKYFVRKQIKNLYYFVPRQG